MFAIFIKKKCFDVWHFYALRYGNEFCKTMYKNVNINRFYESV